MALILKLNSDDFSVTEQMEEIKLELIAKVEDRLSRTETLNKMIDNATSTIKHEEINIAPLIATLIIRRRKFYSYLKELEVVEAEYDEIYRELTEKLPNYLGEHGTVSIPFMLEGEDISKNSTIVIEGGDTKICLWDKNEGLSRCETIDDRFDLLLIKTIFGRLCTQYYRFSNMAWERERYEREIKFISKLLD